MYEVSLRKYILVFRPWLLDGVPLAFNSVSAVNAGTGAPLVAQAPTVRKYFPETWIWDCKDVRFVVITLNVWLWLLVFCANSNNVSKMF